MAQRAALILVVITVVFVFGYVVFEAGLFRWLAALTGLAAVGASVVHFIERGRRSVMLEEAFRRGTAHLGTDENPREVRVGRGETTAPATLLSEGDRWYLEVDGERIAYELEDQGAMSAWPDYRMADFASQLARRQRLTLQCCATCLHFGHSRVSRMASGGWVGFCTASGEGLLIPERDGVHLWHLCKKWKPKKS